MRALRGKRSQAACGRRLKCRSNVLHAWETGVRSPSLSHFAALLRLNGIDLEQTLSALHSAEPSVDAAVRGLRDYGQALRDLAGGRSISDLAQAMARNRNTVARWLEGRTEPRLPDLLCFVHVTTLRLLEFLGQLTDLRALPSVMQAHRDLEAQRRLAYDMPWSHAVLRALELSPYAALKRHVPGFTAKQLGIPLEVEKRCLKALAHAGQIERADGKWQVVRVLSVDTRAEPAKNLALKRHWADVAVQRLAAREAIPADSLYSYNLFAVSEEGLAKIRELHLAYYQQVRALVDASTSPTRVVLMNVQLLPLAES